MKKIAVVTSTRAEYGLLSPLISKLRKKENDDLGIDLVVTGTHLSKLYGMTVDEISERIDHRIEIPVESGSSIDISDNQAETIKRFARLFYNEKYDSVVLLGDRYEILSIAIAACNTRTPIFHLCGGDTTEGAMDEWIRHSITKMSYLHFVSNEEGRKRVIQLGEDPERVFNYGSTSIDNILTLPCDSKKNALMEIGLDECRYALCTYHPVTLGDENVDELIIQFLEAIKTFSEMEFIVTKANADQGGGRINQLLDEAEPEISNLHVYTSLGAKKYISLMKYAEFVLGNSSSGIIEAPALHVPTVNIGDRQKGRLKSDSVINCRTDCKSIVDAIKTAMSDEHKIVCDKVLSPYGTGDAAARIAEKIVETVANGRIDLKKKFYDLG